MADWGLLGGLAEGFKQGLGTYMDTKKSVQEEALRKKQAKMQELETAAKLADVYGSEEANKMLSRMSSDEAPAPQPAQGLVATGMVPTGVIPKRQREINEKLGSMNVQLGSQGKRATFDEKTGMYGQEDIPLTGQAKLKADAEKREQDARQQKLSAEASEAKKKLEGDYLPGYQYDKKTVVNEAEIPKMRDAISDTQKLTTALNSAQQKINSASFSDLANPLSDINQSIQQDLNNARLAYKGKAFAELGVLAGPDLEILTNIIENPSSLKNLARGKEGVVKRLGDLNNTIQSGLQSSLSQRGFSKLPEQQRIDVQMNPKYNNVTDKANAASKPKTVNQGGHTYILNEKTGEYE